MPAYRSRTTTHGRNMAGARALWRATGMTDGQFGKPIIEQQQIAAYLADNATQLDAARLLVFRAAWLRDTRDGRVSSEVAMAIISPTAMMQGQQGGLPGAGRRSWPSRRSSWKQRVGMQTATAMAASRLGVSAPQPAT